jgi:hypothetical protein
VDSILLLGEVIGILAVAETRRAAFNARPYCVLLSFHHNQQESGGRA